MPGTVVRADLRKGPRRDPVAACASGGDAGTSGGAITLREWLEAAVELEAELLNSPTLEESAVDAAIVAINAGGHLRLVVDLHPLGEARLRVRVIERGRAWWLSDAWGRAAP